MTITDWLLKQDPVIIRLTRKYLLDQSVSYETEGIIKKYLTLFDHTTSRFGEGTYSPKWISTHYTLMELTYMECDPSEEVMRKANLRLLDHMWKPKGQVRPYRHQDLCVVSMMIYMAAYIKLDDPRLNEMVDYVMLHHFPDGGWNCDWERKDTKKSSLHTTLSTLEAFHMWIEQGYTYRVDEMKPMMNDAVDFLLRKKIYRSETTGHIIHEDLATYHYPPRWKYDMLRALEYFATAKVPYHPHMEESLQQLITDLQKGYLTKGKQYSGLTHFKLEGKYSPFNTLRALKVLSVYKHEIYQEIIHKDFPKLT